jgi:hypothetical protein
MKIRMYICEPWLTMVDFYTYQLSIHHSLLKFTKPKLQRRSMPQKQLQSKNLVYTIKSPSIPQTIIAATTPANTPTPAPILTAAFPMSLGTLPSSVRVEAGSSVLLGISLPAVDVKIVDT